MLYLYQEKDTTVKQAVNLGYLKNKKITVCGGYFLLQISYTRLMIPTIKIQNCIKSVYVIIPIPPL